MRHRFQCSIVGLAMILVCAGSVEAQAPVLPKPDYDSTLYFMNWWHEFSSSTDAQLANESAYLAANIGSGPYIKTGFSMEFVMGPSQFQFPVDQNQIDSQVASVLNSIDNLTNRARIAGLLIHLHFFTGFYNPINNAVSQAVAADPRNAQWYYTPSGSSPNLANHHVRPSFFWATMSRYASQWMEFKQKYFETLGAGLAQRFFQDGKVLSSVDGDAEVQLSDSRLNCSGCSHISATGNDIADYSPFAVAEFRDWLAHRGEYCDACASNPTAKYKGQGKAGVQSFENDPTPAAFNTRYGTNFGTWNVEGFDSVVGQVIPGGFAAPFFNGTLFNFQSLPTSPIFLVRWLEFRQFLVANALKDYMKWMTSGVFNTGIQSGELGEAVSGGTTGSNQFLGVTLPKDRIFASQIPAEHIHRATPNQPPIRFFVSGSGLETGNPAPYGAAGWTAFNNVDGVIFNRTTDQEFFTRIASMGSDLNWGLFEYFPYIPIDAPPPVTPLWPGLPCTNTIECIVSELTKIRQSKPHILVPFTYTFIGIPGHFVKGTNLETALRQFIADPANKYTPRQFAPGTIFAPPQVQGLGGSHNSAGGVDLSWSANIFAGVNNFVWTEWPQFSRFLLYRSTKSDMSNQVFLNPPDPRANSHRDVPSPLNQRYFYRLRAVNNNGDLGQYSSIVPQDVCAQFGDLDGSGDVSSADADQALRLYLGLDPMGLCSDLVGDAYKPSSTAITPRDALTIAQKANGLIGSLPVP